MSQNPKTRHRSIPITFQTSPMSLQVPRPCFGIAWDYTINKPVTIPSSTTEIAQKPWGWPRTTFILNLAKCHVQSQGGRTRRVNPAQPQKVFGTASLHHSLDYHCLFAHPTWGEKCRTINTLGPELLQHPFCSAAFLGFLFNHVGKSGKSERWKSVGVLVRV